MLRSPIPPLRAFAVATALLVAPAVAAAAPGPSDPPTDGTLPPGIQDARRNLVEAVVDAFPRDERQVYISPTLVFEERPRQIRGDPRHEAEDLAEARERFDARIMRPGEAITCENPQDDSTCSLPGNGILVQFLHPEARRRNGALPFKVVVFYDGRGRNGGIRREMWQMVAAEQPGMGWVVVEKELLAAAEGPR